MLALVENVLALYFFFVFLPRNFTAVFYCLVLVGECLSYRVASVSDCKVALFS